MCRPDNLPTMVKYVKFLTGANTALVSTLVWPTVNLPVQDPGGGREGGLANGHSAAANADSPCPD